MTTKSNGNNKKKGQDTKAKVKKPATPQDDIESLQITFYEIESWIEKTTPILTRMTKELERVSGHFEKRKNETTSKVVDPIEQQLLQIQQQQLTLKRNLLDQDETMQWRLSFQPGNLLRLDTNITSVEQLIAAVQKIRLLQEDTGSTPIINEQAEEDRALELLMCSSPKSADFSQDASSVEYLHYAIRKRPKICLENYKHCHMNLNGLTKNISPTALNYIGQVFWDCLHPKFSSDWKSFWDRSGDPKRNQVCIDSGLALIFLHVMRHDKHICENSQSIAGFYFDRARDELTEFFDEEPDCCTIEALLNLSFFCFVCKEYSQARIYIGLCFHMVTECGIHLAKNLPTDDLVLRKKYLKLLLILYYIDSTLSVYSGEPTVIKDEDFNIDFYEIITLNDKLCELNKTKESEEQVDFDSNKTIVKEAYFVNSIELVRLNKQITLLIERGATVKQLIEEEAKLKAWYDRLPATLCKLDYDFERYEELFKQRDITTPMDASTLQVQAALLTKIQYESNWIILHKAILSSIRSSSSIGSSSPSLAGQEKKSNSICSDAADTIIKISEIITRCFGWCVCQQMIIALYHASTVYCGHALVKNNLELRNRAKLMIHRIMRILEAGTVIYEGFPDDMTECLCEFLKKHGMHNNLECSCINDSSMVVDT